MVAASYGITRLSDSSRRWLRSNEVSPVATGRGTIYVGLPPEQARYLGELIKSGDVGCEMLLDPVSPGVIGVFPMRPVARQ